MFAGGSWHPGAWWGTVGIGRRCRGAERADLACPWFSLEHFLLETQTLKIPLAPIRISEAGCWSLNNDQELDLPGVRASLISSSLVFGAQILDPRSAPFLSQDLEKQKGKSRRNEM